MSFLLLFADNVTGLLGSVMAGVRSGIGAFFVAVLCGDGDRDGLLEGLVHVEILPGLGGGLVKAREIIVFPGLPESGSLDFTLTEWFDFTEILLRGNEHDGDVGLDLTQLGLPLGDVRDAVLLDGIGTEDEEVGVLVDDLAVLGDVLITRGIVDLELHHLLVNVLRALVDIENGGLVVVRERIVQVVLDETRLTDSRISDQDDLDKLLSID